VRPATNAEPNRWLVDFETCAALGIEGQLLVTELEFGMTIAYREHSHATWGVPMPIQPLPGWSA
jgi:hypothetical protein